MKSSFQHNIMLEGALFPAKMKAGLILTMTRRILSYSQNTAELDGVGRITNIVSNDFNRIEKKFRFLTKFLSLPIQFTAIAAIVFYRVKWMGLIIIFLIALTIGLQFLMSKLEAKYQVEVNVYKDSRIKTYTELLEGIRTIKLYAWEMAFKDMIQEIRKIEVSTYLKLKLVRSFNRANAEMSTYLATFVCFSFMLLFQGEDALSAPTIIGVFHPIMVLKKGIKYLR